MFQNEPLTSPATIYSDLRKPRFSSPSVSESPVAYLELLIHRIETCMMQLFTQLRSLAHNKEGELSHPAQTNIINNHSCLGVLLQHPHRTQYVNVYSCRKAH
jgi:hypothetical protein